MKYRPDIDGLRGIAIIFVMMFHYFPNVLKNGFIGVDIFFVISGYIISHQIINKLNTKTFSIKDFYFRRIRRIFPSLIILFVFVFTIGFFAFYPYELKELGRHIFSGAVFYSNFMLIDESGYFTLASEYKPLLHLWSLSIEEQFYLFFPIFLYALNRIQLKAMLPILTIGISSYLYFTLNKNTSSTEEFYAFQARIWELLTGATIAHLMHTREINNQNTQSLNYISALGMIFILLALFIKSKTENFELILSLTIIGTGLIIYCDQADLNKYLFSLKPLVFIGLISFPLYLIHWPILSITRIIDSTNPNHIQKMFLLCISIFFSWLIYKFIERKIRSQKPRLIQITLLVTLTIFCGSIGLVTYRNGGFPIRYFFVANENLYSHFLEGENLLETPNCKRRYQIKDSDYCLSSGINHKKILLVGDSHAQQYYAAIQKQLNNDNIELLMLGKGGCPPLLNIESGPVGGTDHCKKSMTEIFNLILNSSEIKYVVLAARWPLYATGKGYGQFDDQNRFIRYVGTKKINSNSKALNQALTDTLLKLSHAQKFTFLFEDNPEMGFDPKSCFELRPFRIFSNQNAKCSISLSEFKSRADKYLNFDFYNTLNSVAKVATFKPSQFLCSQDQCVAKLNNRPLYRDNNHLSLYGAELLVRQLKFESYFNNRN